LLYLVRHAEQERAAAGQDPDSGVSALGVRQANRLGSRLAGVPFDVIRHSPLRRATQTARIVASYLPGVPVSPSELLRDRTPIPPADELSAVPAPYRAFLDRVPAEERDPGARQLSAVVEELATAGARDRHELLVTHNYVIGWFVRHAVDAPAWRWMGLNQFNCALTIIQISSGLPPVLITFNDLGHLPIELRGQAPIALRS
jgi:probable phosphoglycerate mutase